MKVLLLLAFLALAYAQLPTPCESPKQWTGRLLRLNRERGYEYFEYVTYDETELRIRKLEDREYGDSNRQYLEILRLYKLNVEYRLDLKTRKCNVTTPRMPWRPYGVPPGSKFEGSAVIGASGVSGEFITVSNFYGNFSDGVQFAGVVTSPDCVPIQLDFVGKDSVEHNTFYDIAPGITDPNAFVPPKECLSL